jgi:D-aminopeptidase
MPGNGAMHPRVTFMRRALTIAALAVLFAAPLAAAEPLTVMSFNIRYGTADDGPNGWTGRRRFVGDLVRDHTADIVGLQEALDFQIREIASANPMYAVVGVGRDDGKSKGEFTAILFNKDRLRVADSGTFWFSDTPDVPASRSWGNRITRICTWARFIDRDASAFWVYNLHLDHQSQPSRERSVALLLERVARHRSAGEPVVITGDFNAGEDNPAMLQLVRRDGTPGPFVDTFRVLHPGEKQAGTFNGFKGTMDGPKIDYVLVQPGTAVLSAAIVRTARDGRYPSDHFPVLARIRFGDSLPPRGASHSLPSRGFRLQAEDQRMSTSRPRARDLGIAPGPFEPGPLNAITDVDGVRVGHTTIVQGDAVRTGVTAILPHGGNLFREKVPGAVFVGNAFGKLAGSTQVDELGTIESPVVLTNTLAVGTAVDGVVRWTLGRPGNEDVRSVNALVGETNDGALNEIRGLHVTREHVLSAIAGARGGPVAEGAVGAGTGTIAFGWKGGIGTSSRRIRQGSDEWTVGVIVQTNYGGRLTIAGVPVWKAMDASAETRAPGDGSCMIVVATDAPLDARDLKRLAARAIYALARTGSTYSNGSGDYAIAFSTHPTLRVRTNDGRGAQPRSLLPTDSVSGLFEAALDATEEAVYNSMLQAVDTTGNGRTVRALPVERIAALLKTARRE